MSVYNIKKLVEYLPELEGLAKKANFEEELPTDTKAASLLSYLEMAYLNKVANETVDYDSAQRVSEAIRLYGIEKEAQALAIKMVENAIEKIASEGELESEVRTAEIYLEGQLTGRVDVEKAAAQAEQLYDQYPDLVKSAQVKRYAGAAYLGKEASVNALVYRAKLTGNSEFAKIAKMIQASDTSRFDDDDVRLICHSVTQLDKQAGLINRNFYREALMDKEAANVMVDLGGKQVPVETVIKFGKQRVGQTLGEDIANEMFRDESPLMIKHVPESLPRDIKRTLATLITR